MSTTVNEPLPVAASPTPQSTRVAIREIREAAFRAVVAAGASAAEAKVAAEQVLFAELHRGTGLAALLADLSTGPWIPAGMACTREDEGGRLVLRVSGSRAPGALRQGALLVDLLAAETGPDAVVVSDGLTTLSALLEEPLIRTARSTGDWIIAADRAASGIDLLIAAPDGTIGVGTRASTSRLEPNQDPLPLGVSLGRYDQTPEADVAWLSLAERNATRAEAAHRGRLVDAATWHEVKTAARDYLVAEQ